MNKVMPKRLNWEHIESIPRQEGRKVVKASFPITTYEPTDKEGWEQAFAAYKKFVKF